MQLLVLEGPTAQRAFQITQATTMIGRAPDCDVLVFDAQVSRHHARIVRQGDTFVVEGLQHANPVIINDRLLTGRRVLVDRDLIVVGGVVLEVDLPPPPKSAPTRPGLAAPREQERRTPRAPALPPVPPRDVARAVAARLAAAGQRMQTRAAAHQPTYRVTPDDGPTVDAILAEHERLGGDDELARLAELLSDRLSNQTDIRALYRLGAEASVLLRWTRLADRSQHAAAHLAEAFGVSEPRAASA